MNNINQNYLALSLLNQIKDPYYLGYVFHEKKNLLILFKSDRYQLLAIDLNKVASGEKFNDSYDVYKINLQSETKKQLANALSMINNDLIKNDIKDISKNFNLFILNDRETPKILSLLNDRQMNDEDWQDFLKKYFPINNQDYLDYLSKNVNKSSTKMINK